MILRKSFYKLLLEDLKNRCWLLILIAMASAAMLPVYCALGMENSNNIQKWISMDALTVVGPDNIAVNIMTILSAIVAGLSSFRYLHSRKQVDFYHSIPVTRNKLFAVHYLNGLLLYIFPYALNVILCVIFLHSNNILEVSLYSAITAAFLINILYYSLIYTVTIIAVMLTGTMITGILGTAVLLFYVELLQLVRTFYYINFFKTYYVRENQMDTILLWSPVTSYFASINQYQMVNDCRIRLMLLTGVLLLLIGVAWILYRIRPSEAAGRAIVISGIETYITLFGIVPLTLSGGLILYMISEHHKARWLLLGLLLSYFLAYALFQIILHLDIKSIFHHKRQMLVGAMITGCIVCIFYFDLFHFDNSLPQKDEIKCMSVSIAGIDEGIRNYDESEGNITYLTLSENLEGISLTDFDSAYTLAALGMRSQYNRCPWSEQKIEYNPDEIYSYVVKYTLKNGRKIYRSYRLNQNENRELLKNIYENKEYKRNHFPLYQWKVEDIKEIKENYNLSELDCNLEAMRLARNTALFNRNNNPDELAKLFQTYKEELLKLTWDEAVNQVPVMTLKFKVNNYVFNGYPVYPSFVKTIALLKKEGFADKAEIDLKNIEKITVSYSLPNEEQSGGYNKRTAVISGDTTGKITRNADYTDTTSISGILPGLVDEFRYDNNRTMISVEEGVTVTVYYKITPAANVSPYTFFFRKGKLPYFVAKDLKLTK
jgi:hypothetical protein